MKKRLTLSLLAAVLTIVLVFGFSSCLFQGSEAFDEFTDELFVSMFSDDALSANFLLSDPEALGIDISTATISSPSSKSDYESGYKALSSYASLLKLQFNYSKLTAEQKITYDYLVKYFSARADYGNFYYLQDDFIGSYLGFQANLPIYLAEYHFNKKQDIVNYIAIMKSAKTAFVAYANYEQERIDNGYGRADSVYIGAVEQCEYFADKKILPDSYRDESDYYVETGKDNFLIALFEEKIAVLGFLTSDEKVDFISQNKDAVNNYLVPAYQDLGAAITGFIGLDGNNQQGLYYYDGGKEYYELLFRDATGTNDSLATAELNLLSAYDDAAAKYNSIIQKISTDFGITDSDTLNAKYSAFISSDLSNWTEETISDTLDMLSESIKSDFPLLTSCGDIVLTEVDQSLANNYSPAAHFTSFLDDPEADQVILINIYSNSLSNYNTFDLISHEGFPGHLYQDAYFKNLNINKLRSILGPSSYAEGWATYAENYSTKYFTEYLLQMNTTLSADTVTLYNLFYQLYLLENTINQYQIALMDIWVNYYGYTKEQLAKKVHDKFYADRDLGTITNWTNRVFDHVIEVPCNTATYCYSYIKFIELKKAYAEKLGDDYTDLAFHTAVQQYGALPISMYYNYLIEE